MTTISVDEPTFFVVIPCRNEENLSATLHSIWRCQLPSCRVEVLLIINGTEGDSAENQARSLKTVAETQDWITTHTSPGLVFTLRQHLDIPAKLAGVGLARKIGMDEASSRLNGHQSGLIACLDADCTVAPNYLVALHDHFRIHPTSPGASIYFEHPLADLPKRHRQGIASYELFLRYYRQGIRFAGSPHAFHTVGSAMVVRAPAYRRQGGMNKRQAGEDFYFLQKMMALGGFTEVNHTTVYPSPRVSDRVPFGTGKTMTAWMADDQERFLTYNPQVFQDLRQVFQNTNHLGDESRWQSMLAPTMVQYLQHNHFATVLTEIHANTASPAAFQKRFFNWFNPFRILKYIHWATNHGYPRLPIEAAATTVLGWIRAKETISTDLEEILAIFRHMDKAAA